MATIKKDFQNQKSRTPNLPTLIYGKVPPQAPDMEEAVLAAIMLERDSLDIVIEILPHSEIFYVDAHQKIYAEILKLNNAGRPIDLLTITESLRKSDSLEIVGGAYFLTNLTMAVLSSAHAESHARIIYEKYIQREMIRIGASMLNDAYNDADPFELVEMAQNEIQIVSDIPGAKRSVHISSSAAAVMKKIYENRESAGDITGITTGYPTMDEKMYGSQKGELTILAARPAVGKTAFALNLAFNAVKDRDKKVNVAVFSLEMENLRITERAMAFTAKVDLGNLNRPKRLSETELAMLENSVKALRMLGVYLDDTAILTTTMLRTKARKLIKIAPDEQWLIMVDYLQLMTSTEGKGNREQQVSQISRGLKLIAKELNVPIIALSQLNRGKGEDEEPELKDLRESGAIEQDADNVMFLFRPSAKLIQENSYYANKIMLKGAKFRNGETFLLPLQFDKHYQLFTEPDALNKFTYADKPSAGINGKRDFQPAAPPYQPIAEDDLPF